MIVNNLSNAKSIRPRTPIGISMSFDFVSLTDQRIPTGYSHDLIVFFFFFFFRFFIFTQITIDCSIFKLFRAARRIDILAIIQDYCQLIVAMDLNG